MLLAGPDLGKRVVTAGLVTSAKRKELLMSTDTMLTIKDFQEGIKKGKEGAKKMPGLMKSTAGFFDMLATYVDRIANAHDEGKLVATHGTQQPLEIFEAMDIRGVFNEFWGGVGDMIRLESVPQALALSASTGTPGEVCSFFQCSIAWAVYGT